MTAARLFMVLSTRIAVPAKKSRRFIIRISYNCQPTNECGCPENVSLTPVNSAHFKLAIRCNRNEVAMMSEVHYLLERSSEPDLPFHPDRCWRGAHSRGWILIEGCRKLAVPEDDRRLVVIVTHLGIACG